MARHIRRRKVTIPGVGTLVREEVSDPSLPDCLDVRYARTEKS